MEPSDIDGWLLSLISMLEDRCKQSGGAHVKITAQEAWSMVRMAEEVLRELSRLRAGIENRVVAVLRAAGARDSAG